MLSRLGLGRFDEDDLRLLQVLSDQAAVAIENARLLAGRDRLVEELAALLDISQAGSVARDEGTLAGILAAKLLKATHADACSISRWDEGSTVLHVLGWQGSAARDAAGSMSSPAAAAPGRHEFPAMGGLHHGRRHHRRARAPADQARAARRHAPAAAPHGR